MAITLPLILSVVTAIISAIFAVIVFSRWREKRRPHLIAWSIGLALYFVGSYDLPAGAARQHRAQCADGADPDLRHDTAVGTAAHADGWQRVASRCGCHDDHQ